MFTWSRARVNTSRNKKSGEVAQLACRPVDIGGNNSINFLSYSEDKFVKKYQNPLNVAVKWVGDITKVFLPLK